MSLVISNTSPLYYLHQLDLLELLPALFDTVWVPDAVCRELARGAKLGCKIPDIDQKSWVQRQSIAVPKKLNDIEDLGDGEKEVLALGLVHPSATLILDDLQARQVAQEHSLSLVGTLGILLISKKHGRLGQIAPVLNELVRHGFHLDSNLRANVLRKADEL